jgi:hypothetical protein
MPLFDPYAEIKGYAEFVRQQEFERDAAFLRVRETICGYEVDPLTTRHLLWLYTIESPFLVDKKIRADEGALHVAAFMRVVTPGFNPLSKLNRRLFFWKYRRYFRGQKINVGQAVEEIREYIVGALRDKPPAGDGSSESYWSMAASIVHSLSGHYGWTMDEALDVPVKCAFQLMKIQRLEASAKAGVKIPLFNPSDELKSRWLEEQATKN